MEQLPSAATLPPPAPPTVATSAPEVTPTPTPTPTPKVELKPGEKGRETFEERISRRVKEAQKAAPANPAEKAAADKAAAEKVSTTPTKSEVEMTDAEFKTAVETETKGFKSEKEGQSWAKLRYENRDYARKIKDMVPVTEKQAIETQLTELKTQLEAAKTAPNADPQQIADLKVEIAKLNKRDQDRESELMVAKVERTDAFQNSVTKPREKVATTVEALAKKYEIPARELLDAIQGAETDSDKLAELTEKMNKFDSSKIDRAISELALIGEKETVLRSQAKEALDKISVKTQAELDAQRAVINDARKSAHAKDWARLKEELKDILTPATGTDEVSQAWNKAQTDSETLGRDLDFNSLKPEVQAEYQNRAALYPLLMGKLQAVQTEAVAAKEAEQAALKRLEKYEKSTPSVVTHRTNDDNPTPDPAAGETDFVKRVDARFRAAGIA